MKVDASLEALTEAEIDQAEVAATWPDPIPFGTGPSLADIPADLLPAPAGHYCAAIAAELQVPEALPTLIALGVLATARQRR